MYTYMCATCLSQVQVQVQVVYSRLRENSDKTKLSNSKQVCVFSYVDFVSASQKFLNMYMHIYESIACMCTYVCNISIASMCSGNSIYVHIDLCTHICVRHIYRTLQHIASHCNTLHHTATHCITLQHIASHCDTRPRMKRSQSKRHELLCQKTVNSVMVLRIPSMKMNLFTIFGTDKSVNRIEMVNGFKKLFWEDLDLESEVGLVHNDLYGPTRSKWVYYTFGGPQPKRVRLTDSWADCNILQRAKAEIHIYKRTHLSLIYCYHFRSKENVS